MRNLTLLTDLYQLTMLNGYFEKNIHEDIVVLNMLGAGNGATAFGLKAMKELQTLNKNKKKASPDMIMFLVINISSIQLIPFTMLKIRIDAGSVNPNSIILTTLFATTISTIIGILSCKLLQRRYK